VYFALFSLTCRWVFIYVHYTPIRDRVLTKQTTTDVLICGAGAAGLSLAIDLARRGVDFRLIEKAETPFQGSRGKGVQPRSQEIFEDYGIVDRLFATGGSYPPIRGYSPDGSFVDSPLSDAPGPTPAEPYYVPLMVPQFLTEAVMRERLAELGHRPEFGRELTGFSQDNEGVTAQVGNEIVRARYLVAADGGRSFIRHELGIDFPGETLGARAIVADVGLEGLSTDAWHRFGLGPGQVSLCPLAGMPLFQIQAPVPLEGDVDVSAAGLTALATERTGRDITVHSVAWASVYSMSARLADRYQVGRVFLAGDAGHTHPPTGGQGLNTSLQDSYNLGWKLAAVLGGAPEKLLTTYDEERRPIAAGMLGMTERLLVEMKTGSNSARPRDAAVGPRIRRDVAGVAVPRTGGLAGWRPGSGRADAQRGRPGDAPVFGVPGSALDITRVRSGSRCHHAAVRTARPHCRFAWRSAG
jgi:2-polyprenyl-6-methoxyphenol hydroxylase-like FAD-dependent oxidoreductase